LTVIETEPAAGKLNSKERLRRRRLTGDFMVLLMFEMELGGCGKANSPEAACSWGGDALAGIKVSVTGNNL